MRRTKSVQKFLESYAEDTARLGSTLSGLHDHAVVIPSYGESDSLDEAIQSIPCTPSQATLCVVTINARDNSPQHVLDTNAATAARLRSKYRRVERLEDGTSVHEADFGRLVLLERQLPNSQGVGLARKFGVDFALGAWAQNKLRSNWIHCTDADVRLPPNYFAEPGRAGAAMLLNFRHVTRTPSLERSARIYDAWLRAYVLGLAKAGSPYAFHTIGSTIAVDAASYAAVRGFPKRNAAEDFYLLNKLSKQGAIVRSPAAPIEIAARLSSRVPFGTGRAMNDAQRGGEGALPLFYDLSLFDYLAIVLQAATRSIRDATSFESALREGSEQCKLASGSLLSTCKRLEIDTAVDMAISAALHVERRQKAFQGWFDAFKTMKFIHAMRDSGIESNPFAVAVRRLPMLLSLNDEWTDDDRSVLRETIAQLCPQAA